VQIAAFGQWCEALNLPGLPPWDVVPMPPLGQAVRYSVEIPAPTLYNASTANLQSFMAVQR